MGGTCKTLPFANQNNMTLLVVKIIFLN